VPPFCVLAHPDWVDLQVSRLLPIVTIAPLALVENFAVNGTVGAAAAGSPGRVGTTASARRTAHSSANRPRIRMDTHPST
jgi:hypothetical protein